MRQGLGDASALVASYLPKQFPVAVCLPSSVFHPQQRASKRWLVAIDVALFDFRPMPKRLDSRSAAAPFISSSTQTCGFDDKLKTTVHRFGGDGRRKCECGDIDNTGAYERIDPSTIAKLLK